ncbi:HTH-type transcriptional activator TipA [Actinorhabdospora filicis]|uniref:HTH-type transcriptional activator TipA n=1 Tax=Actinorhabdospora filicis TaxID=1785913 RepID=A0A9W6WA01_9ACTN|nr:MerR family transcriptional regulator [Actinorhabdospora filicis]GLZ79144.1 HTH-type transcriptional activator TipA [Actinorhabdospora filicis]
MPYTVGRAAALAGVTVRTLHHYDRLGLVRPRGRDRSGYRRYTDGDLERLHQVLSYRELGFGLDDIARLLDDPDARPLDHLRRQRSLLEERIARLTAMARAIEHMMEATEMGLSLTPEERFEVFGEHDPAKYEDEVQRKWGASPAYSESRRRTASYDKAQWAAIKAEAEAITLAFKDAMARGEPATGAAAMDLAEEHRAHITRRYYDCGYDVHRGLAAMYVRDPRFTATYDVVAPGLAAYISAAITANADRAGA